jgi:hypothetical protein
MALTTPERKQLLSDVESPKEEKAWHSFKGNSNEYAGLE